MAKCGFPLGLVRSFYKTGASTCTAKAKIDIIFQGKKMKVCKIHSGYNGRDRLF